LGARQTSRRRFIFRRCEGFGVDFLENDPAVGMRGIFAEQIAHTPGIGVDLRVLGPTFFE